MSKLSLWDDMKKYLPELDDLGIKRDHINPLMLMHIEDKPINHRLRAENLYNQVYKRKSSELYFISKKKILDVSENNLNLYGSVSKEVVIDMINGLRKKTNSDIFLAISGIAGPGGGTINKPEGLVWVSYALKNKVLKISKLEFGPIGRDLVREKSTIQSLKFLLSLLGD